MTIGNELDGQFLRIAQRLDKLEDTNNMRSIEEFEDRLVDLEGKVDNNDVDDVRCDLECQIEEVNDTVGYHDDRLDDIEAYKMTEEEVSYLLDKRLSDISDSLEDELMDRATELVHHEINAQVDARIAALEARLNQPTLSARLVRWLREGPSIRETATGWYAGIRRGR